MKENHKFPCVVRKKDEKNIQFEKEHVKEWNQNTIYEKKEQKHFANLNSVDYEGITKQEDEGLDYVVLFHTLKNIRKVKKYEKKMDTSMLPYKIPEVYSLKKEIENLAIIEKRIDILSQNMCKEDTNAMFSDWKKVGNSINEAICKVGRSNRRCSN